MTADEAAHFKQLVLDKSAEQRVRVKNRLHDKIQWEYLRLRETVEGRGALRALMGDASPRVQLAAATRVLDFDPQKARVVLIELATRSDMVGFEVGLVVKGFDSGDLNVGWRPRSGRGKPAPPDVGADELDSALTVHGRIMNGGFELAWEIDQEAFRRAGETLRAIGRGDAQKLFVAAQNALLSVDDASAEERASKLSAQYYDLPDVQRSLEAFDVP